MLENTGKVSKMPVIQLLLITLSTVYFFLTADLWLSAIFGGLISLVNTGLINRHISKQKSAQTMSPQACVGMMVFSVGMRLILVVSFILIGIMILKFDAHSLIVSLVLGLVGFLIDKVKQK
jgi:ATP synthase protein I